MSILFNERTLILNHLEIQAYTGPSGTVHFCLRGDIDVSNAKAAAARLLHESSNEKGDVTCDLSGVDFIDSSGLRALVDVQHESIKNERILRVVLGDNHRLRRLFGTCGLDRVLSVVDHR